MVGENMNFSHAAFNHLQKIVDGKDKRGFLGIYERLRGAYRRARVRSYFAGTVFDSANFGKPELQEALSLVSSANTDTLANRLRNGAITTSVSKSRPQSGLGNNEDIDFEKALAGLGTSVGIVHDPIEAGTTSSQNIDRYFFRRGGMEVQIKRFEGESDWVIEFYRQNQNGRQEISSFFQECEQSNPALQKALRSQMDKLSYLLTEKVPTSMVYNAVWTLMNRRFASIPSDNVAKKFWQKAADEGKRTAEQLEALKRQKQMAQQSAQPGVQP
jgi:hypothetical protein